MANLFGGGEVSSSSAGFLSFGGVSPGRESPNEATVMRNMTRRSARRETEEPGDSGGLKQLSLGGEGRLLQLESENASLAGENEKLRERVARLEVLARRRSSEALASGRRRSSRRSHRRRHLLRDSILHTVEETTPAPQPAVRVSRDKMSRTASVGTANVLRELPRRASSFAGDRQAVAQLAQRVMDVFREPLRAEHTAYLCSQHFADDLAALSEVVARKLEREPRVARIESPAYVFGDVHGNLEDLHFFSDHIWKLGVALVGGHLLFLGDYVDRGLSSLEVVAYLFALKTREPRKVWLLRGNHETRDVNGWKEHYGDRSFLWQCEQRFGPERGALVWEAVNDAFDRLPLAALVDDEIFCVHGGIPRRPRDADAAASRLDLIDCIPSTLTINPPQCDVDPELQRMASECVWSDPALEDQEPALDASGFGESMRGGGTICFGHAAIKDFLAETGCSFIMRAHEAHAYGVSLSKMATVFTIFSTSKDHHQGSLARAGCVLIDLEAIQVINRSPHYKNRYVHRRDSISLAGLTAHELKQRAALGLVVPDDEEDAGHYLGFDEDDFYDDDDDDDGLDEDDDERFAGLSTARGHRRPLSGDHQTPPVRGGPAARLVDANYSFMPDDEES
ncbi:hypothetical protein CTAYLR_004080 [Chrysophaeum taylorii]|uniref:Serine/threonine-protein phosphatase n=1 Tax=Chrysophaeum taylorii TaxID=2483200 RepID=A0AAD7UQ86_9STRA|nr:hypothetical protein CTAYLR_004080 [Chrysophaeum taylorii]